MKIEIKIENSIFEDALNLLFPDNLYCICCQDTIDEKTRVHSLCDKCIEKIRWISDNPYRSSMKYYSFEELYSCCIYGFLSRHIISRFKFEGEGYIAKPLGKLMADRLLLAFDGDYEEIRHSFDYICFVPITRKKKFLRGFNQGELLAKAVSKELDIPILDVLEKPKETLPVKLQGKRDRASIIRGAFRSKVLKKIPEGCRILLVDDVFTTGSTAEEVTQTLLLGGASKVYVLVFASGDGLSSSDED